MSWWIYSLALGLVLGCREPIQPLESGTLLEHPNGLRLLRPDGFEERLTERGFALDEAGNLRTPRRIQVERADIAPTFETTDQVTFEDGELLGYTIVDMGGGSGGTEYELRAARSLGSGWVVLTARVQTELSPNFGLAFRVFATADSKR